MACLRCRSNRQERIRQLALLLDGVQGRQAVGVNALRCADCGYLELEIPNAAAVPQEIIGPHRED